MKSNIFVALVSKMTYIQQLFKTCFINFFYNFKKKNFMDLIL